MTVARLKILLGAAFAPPPCVCAPCIEGSAGAVAMLLDLYLNCLCFWSVVAAVKNNWKHYTVSKLANGGILETFYLESREHSNIQTPPRLTNYHTIHHSQVGCWHYASRKTVDTFTVSVKVSGAISLLHMRISMYLFTDNDNNDHFAVNAKQCPRAYPFRNVTKIYP